MPTLDWDSPAEVKWSAEVITDQIAASGDKAQSRSFSTLLEAVRFVMNDLDATPRMMVGVYPDRGSALIGLAEIEQASRSGPHDTDEPGGVA